MVYECVSLQSRYANLTLAAWNLNLQESNKKQNKKTEVKPETEVNPAWTRAMAPDWQWHKNQVVSSGFTK